VSSGRANDQEEAQDRHNPGAAGLPLASGRSSTSRFPLLRRAAGARATLLWRAFTAGLPASKAASAAVDPQNTCGPGGLTSQHRKARTEWRKPWLGCTIWCGQDAARAPPAVKSARQAQENVIRRARLESASVPASVSYRSCGAGWKGVASTSRSGPFLARARPVSNLAFAAPSWLPIGGRRKGKLASQNRGLR
jgi:hypothetical protein